jgi:hypothetical protein
MELLGELAFRVGERGYRYADVVDAARAWGNWARVEERAREGGEPVDADAFRYARGLLSADDMRAWLASRHLSEDDWERWLARALPRDALVEAVCSGELERLARKLAERAAVWNGAGRAASDRDEVAGDAAARAVWNGRPEWAALENHFAAWCATAVTPAAIERVLSTHRLDWTRVRCRLLRTPDPGVAAEAALCVREDGRDLAGVAAAARLALADERLYLSDTALGPRLTGARVGELVGPVAVGGEHVLALVTERASPSAEDPDTRARAREAVVQRAVETELLRRVRWAR